MKQIEYIHKGDMAEEDLKFCLNLGYFGSPPTIEKTWIDAKGNVHILVREVLSKKALEELELQKQGIKK